RDSKTLHVNNSIESHVKLGDSSCFFARFCYITALIPHYVKLYYYSVTTLSSKFRFTAANISDRRAYLHIPAVKEIYYYYYIIQFGDHRLTKWVSGFCPVPFTTIACNV
ncbi:hypothetical protein ACJX0J_023820, partial [Zea mays]